MKFIDRVDFRHWLNYDPSLLPVRKVPMQQLLKDLLTAYKFGVKILYYQKYLRRRGRCAGRFGAFYSGRWLRKRRL